MKKIAIIGGGFGSTITSNISVVDDGNQNPPTDFLEQTLKNPPFRLTNPYPNFDVKPITRGERRKKQKKRNKRY